VRAAFGYRKKAGRREYVRVKLTRTADGTVEAVKHAQEGAGIITSLTETDGLVELSEDTTMVAPGATVGFLSYAALAGEGSDAHGRCRERDVDRLLNAVENDDGADREHGRHDASDDEGRHGLFPPIHQGHFIPPIHQGHFTTIMNWRRPRSSAQRSHCCAAIRSASAASAGVLTLKKGSTGVAGQSPMAMPWRAVQLSILCMFSSTSALRRSSRSATGHTPTTGCRQPPERAQASGTSAACRAADKRATRSAGRNGQSPGTLATSGIAGACVAAQSSPARMPASGPAKPSTVSGITGKPVSAKRAGSPLALRMTAAHCGLRRTSTRSRMVLPPMRMRVLAP